MGAILVVMARFHKKKKEEYRKEKGKAHRLMLPETAILSLSCLLTPADLDLAIRVLIINSLSLEYRVNTVAPW